MRKFYRLILLLLMAGLSSQMAFGQYASEYTGGLKVKLNDDGSKYIRFITWHQMWSTTTLTPGGSASANADFSPTTDFLLRRSRFLAFAQISKRFLILTHFGLNSLGPGQMGNASPSAANGGNGPFFMHDAWVEYTVLPGNLYIGGGLHYFQGWSRLTNQSTLNFLTLDAPIHNWATIGTSDQFARHLGFYAKGFLGKLEYRLSFNQANGNPSRGIGLDALINTRMDTSYVGTTVEYQNGVGETVTGEFIQETITEVEVNKVANRAAYRIAPGGRAGKVFTGYVNYQFLDKESNTLPYYVGTYMGGKRVFNVGVGFYYHENGAAYYESEDATELTIVSPTTISADVFYDSPLGESDLALTFYGSFANHNWGPNWTGAVGGAGTGNIIYAQAGLGLPPMAEGKLGRLQPYLHFTYRDLDAQESFEKSTSEQFGAGVNWFLDGHNSKITLEFQSNASAAEVLPGDPQANNLLRLQLMVFL